MPAILIETAFIDNEKEAKILKYKHSDFAKWNFHEENKNNGFKPFIRYVIIQK